ncbi:hypothetical protein J5X84_09955 [Streptosporangiaceae bacterium NEAU-GS5]|nr:hypothetical protein [Streptosporangiaceae bacterium NEAU-GS5]
MDRPDGRGGDHGRPAVGARPVAAERSRGRAARPAGARAGRSADPAGDRGRECGRDLGIHRAHGRRQPRPALRGARRRQGGHLQAGRGLPLRLRPRPADRADRRSRHVPDRRRAGRVRAAGAAVAARGGARRRAAAGRPEARPQGQAGVRDGRGPSAGFGRRPAPAEPDLSAHAVRGASLPADVRPAARRPVARHEPDRRRPVRQEDPIPGVVVRPLLALVALLALSPVPAAAAATTPTCGEPYRIDRTLPDGARWTMCWEMRNIEGLTLTQVAYTPKNGRAVGVLRSASLAQIQVPYDSGEPRYEDIGALGAAAIPLRAQDCPGGERPDQYVCVTTRPRGHAYFKDEPYASAQGDDLVVFSAFQVGWYTYLAEWAFGDTGTITPRVGATGSLADFTTTPAYGWPIGVGRHHFEESHSHNIFWRLDFDIDGRSGDRVEQYDFSGSGTTRRTMRRTALTRETAAVYRPMRWWRVVDYGVRNADGHAVSWEIDNSGSAQYRGPASERFTHADLYVTNYRACERLASENPTPRCADSVDKYVNGEVVRDPVVWVNVDFHHVVRDEDHDPMPTHWQGFHITPRDVTSTNPYR